MRAPPAGELLVGPVRALFADEISTGLDSNTTYQARRPPQSRSGTHRPATGLASPCRTLAMPPALAVPVQPGGLLGRWSAWSACRIPRRCQRWT